ncbi:hypothetical protein MLD38_010888 [Melastoma candidum]|uniref:Uncharacterized protein n=1 Tax=Melastoma candidum TaxID=119954 RepID=A0ACB9R1A7_9MYRT|nr:hypothetical protein MLD38_010888 [Melastoma candidum]
MAPRTSKISKHCGGDSTFKVLALFAMSDLVSFTQDLALGMITQKPQTLDPFIPADKVKDLPEASIYHTQPSPVIFKGQAVFLVGWHDPSKKKDLHCFLSVYKNIGFNEWFISWKKKS